jgi:hypothetical protein
LTQPGFSLATPGAGSLHKARVKANVGTSELHPTVIGPVQSALTLMGLSARRFAMSATQMPNHEQGLTFCLASQVFGFAG